METPVVLQVRVTPRAGRTGFAGMRDDVLLVRLAAPPVEGAANAALIAFLSKVLDVPKRDLAIVSGERARDKRVAVGGLSPSQLRQKLSAILPS